MLDALYSYLLAPATYYTHHFHHAHEFNVEAARQMSLSAEVRMCAEYNVKEKRRETEAAESIRLRAQASNFEAAEKSLLDEANALKERNAILEKERNALDVKITSIKSHNDNLVDRVHELETSSSGLQENITVYKNCMEQLEKFQDEKMKVVNDKLDKLYIDFLEMALHLEEKFYPHLITTISGHRWLLTHGMELAIVKCLNALEYLSALGAAISKAIEKAPECEFLFACEPNVDQLMVPIHCSSDEVVLGATALSLALDVSSARVWRIRKNIANQRSALRDVFVPLAEPFSAAVLTGTEGITDIVPATANTTTALSITFASTSSITPISVDDYEVVGADDQAVADGNAASFPNVDDAELNILE
ncbi:hypothetical protein Tco_0641598 [Tanacetum coccineum]